MRWLRGSSKKKKVAVIGLDGTPFTFLKSMVEKGEMPNLARILEGGSFQQMKSALPTVSSVAWSSFNTGSNPGKHGIFGFVDRADDSYEIFIPTSKDVKSPAIWDILSVQGKQVVVINVPLTYPPRPVRGVMVSDFLTPDLSKGTYPETVYPKLKEMGYRLDIDSWRARRSREELLDDFEVTLRKRKEAIVHFLDTEPWDFFMALIMETDRLHHFMWEVVDNGASGERDKFLACYHQIDEALGEIVAKLGPDVTLMMMSDHGFCTLNKEVYLNHWLEQEGWLKFNGGEGTSLKDMDSESLAYSLDPGRFYLNLEGREPRGTVKLGSESKQARQKLASALMALKDPESGEKIIDRVHEREEIYSGLHCNRAPDLVAVPRRGFDLKGALGKGSLTGRETLVGMHTYDDAFLFVQGQKIIKEDLEIIDVMPTILRLMGVPAPPQLDGQVCIE